MTSLGAAAAPDRRTTRWDAHRVSRRSELVDAALRAVRHHGAGVGMDEIAAQAGTSKTVLYRHFTDRDGLYRAVAEQVDRRVRRDLVTAMRHHDQPRDQLLAAIDAYLQLVENDPEVYRFVIGGPLGERAGADPVTGLTDVIAEQLTLMLAARLRFGGIDSAAAAPWAHALVGAVRAAADHWLRGDPARSPMTRADLARHLTDLTWTGLSGALPDHTAGTLPDHSEEP